VYDDEETLTDNTFAYCASDQSNSNIFDFSTLLTKCENMPKSPLTAQSFIDAMCATGGANAVGATDRTATVLLE
jgi:hypothetical protein